MNFELYLELLRDIFPDQQTYPITRTVEETFYGRFAHCHVRFRSSYLMIISYKTKTYYGNILKINFIKRSTPIIKNS